MPMIISTSQEVGEQRVVLRRTSWETYERLLAEHLDASSPRFTYDQGELEIMSPSMEHEKLKEIIAAIAALLEWERQRLERARAALLPRRIHELLIESPDRVQDSLGARPKEGRRRPRWGARKGTGMAKKHEAQKKIGAFLATHS
jgi:Uma2 family endonuclease